jgi:hypothetical protein
MPAYSRETEVKTAFKSLLEQGLEQAVIQDFCKLFDVLMSAPKEQHEAAMKRFAEGINKLAMNEEVVAKFIRGEYY